MELSRRDVLKIVGAGAVGAALSFSNYRRAIADITTEGGDKPMAEKKKSGPVGQYLLPPLPYETNALEPVIDAKTVLIHHDKHHAGYVTNANKVLEQLAAARAANDFAQIKALSRNLAFQASGAVLHDLYWLSMTAKPQKGPEGNLARQVAADFGSVEALKGQFAAAAKEVEGSGWATLAWEPTIRKLLVLQIEKHQDLTIWGATPLLVCDVWEHAYYLKYQNKRPDYVDGWMDIIDWKAAGERFDKVG
jgi:Fe-Mn family superoxide dismutase